MVSNVKVIMLDLSLIRSRKAWVKQNYTTKLEVCFAILSPCCFFNVHQATQPTDMLPRFVEVPLNKQNLHVVYFTIYDLPTSMSTSIRGNNELREIEHGKT